MLLLSRKRNQRIKASIGGEDLVITVVEIRGDKVRLGFEAGPEVVIHREEIWDRINSASNGQSEEQVS